MEDTKNSSIKLKALIIVVFLSLQQGCPRAGSLVGLSHALLHDLPQVWVLHRRRHPLLVIDLLVDCKTPRDRGVSSSQGHPRPWGCSGEKDITRRVTGKQGRRQRKAQSQHNHHRK